jgi:hypothetical protein
MRRYMGGTDAEVNADRAIQIDKQQTITRSVRRCF